MNIHQFFLFSLEAKIKLVLKDVIRAIVMAAQVSFLCFFCVLHLAYLDLKLAHLVRLRGRLLIYSSDASVVQPPIGIGAFR